MDLGDRPDQLVDVAQPLLQQVGLALRAVPQQLQGVLGVMVLGEDDDADVGVVLPQVPGQRDPLCRVGRWHADVEDGDVDVRVRQQLQHLLGPRHAAHQPDLGRPSQDGLDPLPYEVVVLCDSYSDQSRCPPANGGGSTTPGTDRLAPWTTCRHPAHTCRQVTGGIACSASGGLETGTVAHHLGGGATVPVSVLVPCSALTVPPGPRNGQPDDVVSTMPGLGER